MAAQRAEHMAVADSQRKMRWLPQPPEKTGDQVLVKSQYNVDTLLIVHIDRDFRFQSKLIERSELSGNSGKYLKGRLP